MIDILENYFWRSLPDTGDFVTNPGLALKANAEGKLLPYQGNTVVFLLDDATRKALTQYQDMLYQAVPEMLSEKLREDTFHMTLHSLMDGKPDQPGLDAQMRHAQQTARQILSGWDPEITLSMKTSWLFNMVNTSIVLGLMPADQATERKLDEMYIALEAVRPLGYPMTPHITMAYFRPGKYGEEHLRRLRSALQNVDLEIELSMNALVLQNFSDMNHYQTV